MKPGWQEKCAFNSTQKKNDKIVKTYLTYKAILDQIEQIHEEKIELYNN